MNEGRNCVLSNVLLVILLVACSKFHHTHTHTHDRGDENSLIIDKVIVYTQADPGFQEGGGGGGGGGYNNNFKGRGMSFRDTQPLKNQYHPKTTTIYSNSGKGGGGGRVQHE